MLVDAAIGLVLYKTLGGRFSSVLPSALHVPGALSHDSLRLPATKDYANSAKRARLEDMFRQHGCHHCGTRKGDVIGDHMPPNRVVHGTKAEQRLAQAEAQEAVAELAMRHSSRWGQLFDWMKRSLAFQKASASAVSTTATATPAGSAAVPLGRKPKPKTKVKRLRPNAASTPPGGEAGQTVVAKQTPGFFSSLQRFAGIFKPGVMGRRKGSTPQYYYPQCSSCSQKQSSAIKNNRRTLVMHTLHPERWMFAGALLGVRSYVPGEASTDKGSAPINLSTMAAPSRSPRHVQPGTRESAMQYLWELRRAEASIREQLREMKRGTG
eukprot:jgi/Mesvir1/25483/Mv01743-RA.3